MTYDAILRNAMIVSRNGGLCLFGEIFNDSKKRFLDGMVVSTSGITEHLPGGIIVTANTRYLVYWNPKYSAPVEQKKPMSAKEIAKQLHADLRAGVISKIGIDEVTLAVKKEGYRTNEASRMIDAVACQVVEMAT